MPVHRFDPEKIPASLKEAVADALVNIVHANVAGIGEFGRAAYGAPPSRLMVSAFLPPKRKEDDGDEVTSPIWISSHGLDVQIGATGGGALMMRPKFAVYVRVFPTEEDLKRPDCRLRRPPLLKVKQQELAAK